MTAQIQDRVIYQRRNYHLTAFRGGPLFEPAAHNLSPVPPHTACWRGWHGVYALRGDELILRHLYINLLEEQPILFGVQPEVDRFDGLRYRRVDIPVGFTGGMLLAKDFIQELYVHMGFHAPWKYREVQELIFEGGRMISARDCSLLAAQMRERMKARARAAAEDASPAQAEEDIRKWIEHTFSRSYPIGFAGED